MFQIFATIACYYIWFVRNKTHRDDLIPDTLVISTTINRIVLEHHSAWNQNKLFSRRFRSVPPTLILRSIMIQPLEILFQHRQQSAEIQMVLLLGVFLLSVLLAPQFMVRLSLHN